MKFVNEFIFDNEADAQKFIRILSNIYYEKGYLYYGDVCKAYFNDNINYNEHNIYKRYGWNSIYIFEAEPYDNNKFRVKFPEIEKISKGELK